MNPNDIPIKKKPKLANHRTFPDGFSGDDSSLNIAISDLLISRDFLLDTKSELNEPILNFAVSSPQGDNVTDWANYIRAQFEISLDEQFKLGSVRKFYLYVRKRIESNGIFIHSFTDVDLSVSRTVAIFYETMPIIGLNDADRYPAKTFSMIHELVHRKNNRTVN